MADRDARRSGGQSPAALGWAQDHIWALIIAGSLVVAGWWAIGTRTQDHHVTASFSSAALVVPGLDVKLDGLTVGKVGDVEYRDGDAVVRIGIDDHDAWPLRRGTRAVMRFGTTIGNGTRYIELQPGPANASPIPEDGVIPERDSHSAVEFDQVFNTVDGATRAHLRSLLGRTDAALGAHAPQLREGLHRLPAAVNSTGDLLSDLAADGKALDGLVVNTSRVSRTLASRTPAVADLVDVASATFARFAGNADALGATLQRMPGALGQTRTTLARLHTSVDDRLTPLIDTLRPGARQLPALATAASRAVGELRDVAPSALSTVSALHSAAPGLTDVLTRGRPLAQKATSAIADLAPMMACIRPYAPEAGGFFVGWGSWVKNYTLRTHPDPNPQGRYGSHYARVQALAGPESVHDYPTNLPISKILSLIPGVRYAFPMPPGFLADKPMLNAACGYGPDSLDPSKDPENGKP